jgi:DNA-binding transcriptional MerR regulator
MNEESVYSIGELAQRAGVTARTIRYYTAEGLLPPPGTRGRYASYTEEHVQRLALIAQLKAQYLPLHAIREQLAASSAPPPSPTGARSPFALGQRAAGRFPDASGPSMLAAESLGGADSPLQLGRYQFFPYTEPPQPAEETPLGPTERWQRVVIAPGVEIHVREPLSAERRDRLAALVAAARDQLAGDDAAD